MIAASAIPVDGSILRWRALAAGWWGLAVAVGWLLLVALVQVVSVETFGPARLPVDPGLFVWTVAVNGALLGLLVAGELSLARGVGVDLHALRTVLPSDGTKQGAESHQTRVERISQPPAGARWLTTMAGLLFGLAVATLDPSLRELHGHLARLDPRYLVFLLQNLLFGALTARLCVTEIHMTRAYARLGEQVKVDLLQPSSLLAFGRKGLRSASVWGSVSAVFSLFWLLDSAGQANVALAVAVLGLATAALVAPTRGVRRNVAAAKSAELETCSEAIRWERDRLLSSPGAPGAGRLADLIQYQSFVKSVREWPFDLSIVSRSSLFILLGAGSWLGGAVVERLLGLLLD